MPNILRIIKKPEQRGQGLVEFALVLPLLLLLVWGVIEFGRILYIYTEVSNATREAVRYGVARGRDSFSDGPNYLDCEGIRRAARSTAVLTGLPDSDFRIGYDRGGGAVFATCEEQPTDVHFGDRLVITVTHEIEPLVLLRDSGSLRVMFATARTIVEEGIPVDGETPPGDGDDDDSPIGDSPEVTFVLDDPFACRGHLEWTSVPYADSYITYRTVPTPTQELASGILGLRYPETGNIQAADGEEYAVRGFNEFGRGPLFGRDIVAGCNDPAETEPLELDFVIVETDPCEGYFTWRSVANADSYRLYDNDGELVAEVPPPLSPEMPRYPYTTTLPVANGEVYVVTALNEYGEGLETPETVTGCTLPPAEPTGLTYYLDQGTPPCEGHFRWDSVLGADMYYIYQDGTKIGEIDVTRFPGYPDNLPVATGEVYTVTAYNETGGESGPSNEAIADGCFIGPTPVDVTYYLHSVPSPPHWHSDAPPPLFMDEKYPGHPFLYNYNSSDPAKPGREVAKGGSTPGQTSPDKFLEWRTDVQVEPLTLFGYVHVKIWGRNPANQTVLSKAFLYELDQENGYSLISQTTYSWPAGVTQWQEATLNFYAGGRVIDEGNRLVVWVISDNAKSLHFAYDTTVYPSQIEFTGKWYDESN